MIISHRHKFIFLKTNKTAGTSIEIALSRFCGPDDVITPISAEDEETRRQLGYPGPQNYLASISGDGVPDPLGSTGERQPKDKLRFYNHISAKEVKARIDEQEWNSYYKFCFERNPWDRLISLYFWRTRPESRPTISEFIRSGVPLTLKERGYGLYTIDGEIVVDRVCRFENLSEELEAVRTRVGIPESLELPTAKSRHRSDRRSYRDLLGEDDKAWIAELFCDEIRMFKYEW